MNSKVSLEKENLSSAIGLQNIHDDVRDKFITKIHELVFGDEFGPAIEVNGCLESQKSLDANSGYLKVDFKKKKFFVHEILMIFKLGQTEYSVAKCNKQVSHLCHNKKCLMASHMTLEFPVDNIQRQVCANVGHCFRSLNPRHSEIDCILPTPNEQQMSELLHIFTGENYTVRFLD